MSIEKIIANDQYARHSGIELVEIGNGSAFAKMTICPHHLNGVGIVQGGAIYTLADFTLAAAANSHGQTAVSLACHITYFIAESSGTLFAKATEISLRRTIATYQVDISNKDDQLVASFQGTVYRK